MSSFSMKFDLKELDDFQKDMLKMANEVKNGKYTKQMLRNTGNKLKRRVLKHAKSSVQYDPKNNWTINGKTYSPTGNFFRGQRRGRVYFYAPNNSYAVRVFGGAPAYHSNWLESGHNIILPNGTHHGRFEGYQYFTKGFAEYEPEFYKDVDKFIDKMIAKNLL